MSCIQFQTYNPVVQPGWCNRTCGATAVPAKGDSCNSEYHHNQLFLIFCDHPWMQNLWHDYKLYSQGWTRLYRQSWALRHHERFHLNMGRSSFPLWFECGRLCSVSDICHLTIGGGPLRLTKPHRLGRQRMSPLPGAWACWGDPGHSQRNAPLSTGLAALR